MSSSPSPLTVARRAQKRASAGDGGGTRLQVDPPLLSSTKKKQKNTLDTQQKKKQVKKEEGGAGQGGGVGGWVLPAIALSIGVLTLGMTYALAWWTAPAGTMRYWFISQMGSAPPALYVYSFGCPLAAGMLVACAWMFASHNDVKLRTDLSSTRRTLNRVSFCCAVLSVLGLGAQSVIPMGDGNPVHIGFASVFFLGVWQHALFTSLLYAHAYRDSRDHKRTQVLLDASERFWVMWKIVWMCLTSVFTLLTVMVLGYDGWLHIDEGFDAWGPSFFTWLTSQKEQTIWMRSGAVCEYATVASLLCYFISYFHDLAKVRVVVQVNNNSSPQKAHH